MFGCIYVVAIVRQGSLHRDQLIQCTKCIFNKAFFTAMCCCSALRECRGLIWGRKWSNSIWHYLILREKQWCKRQLSFVRERCYSWVQRASGYICSQLRSSALNTWGNEKPNRQQRVSTLWVSPFHLEYDVYKTLNQ